MSCRANVLKFPPYQISRFAWLGIEPGLSFTFASDRTRDGAEVHGVREHEAPDCWRVEQRARRGAEVRCRIKCRGHLTDAHLSDGGKAVLPGGDGMATMRSFVIDQNPYPKHRLTCSSP